MSEAKERIRWEQAFKDALQEIATGTEASILKAFDSEHGYNSKGVKVAWPELNTEYVTNSPPRGRGGSAHPILFVKGDLRSSIKAVVEGWVLSTDVTSQKMKPRGKGSISVAEISSILHGGRPHTNPSSDWIEGSQNIEDIFEKHLKQAYNDILEGNI